jgi:hypothetical protein
MRSEDCDVWAVTNVTADGRENHSDPVAPVVPAVTRIADSADLLEHVASVRNLRPIVADPVEYAATAVTVGTVGVVQVRGALCVTDDSGDASAADVRVVQPHAACAGDRGDLDEVAVEIVQHDLELLSSGFATAHAALPAGDVVVDEVAVI